MDGDLLIFPADAIIYRFERFELDVGRFELRERGEPVHLEPQVFALLMLLASNPERLVSKDEIIEKIWDGRFISDAAVASRIKSARSAIGDDGKQQRLIRTVHGKGLRFVGQVTFAQDQNGRSFASEAETSDIANNGQEPDGRPSIAIIPFRLLSEAGPLSFLADALADEIITDLARLRWLLVIARGSSFRFRGQDLDCREVGKSLNVRYCLWGTIEAGRGNISVLVEMARTSDGAIVWAERFSAGLDELQEVRSQIVAEATANLEIRIPQHEAQLARARPPAALDSWSAYHLGLDFMFRFNRSDNTRAADLFKHALSLDQGFGRAYGGLSFTRFQEAFLQYSPDFRGNAEQARLLAEQALQCDPFDPFAHLNLGRSLWLQGEIGESLERLSSSIALSPNYAQAVYSKAWAEMTQCDVENSEAHAALALRLSPLDPLHYAMLAVQSINALLREDYERAALLGERAARSPGAHKHIAVIAALGTRLAGKRAEASEWISRAKQQDPDLSKAAFLRSFPFKPSASRELIEATLEDLGL